VTRERRRASPFEDAAERRASQYEAHAPRTLPVVVVRKNGRTAPANGAGSEPMGRMVAAKLHPTSAE
jgi:hypothetical protein